MSRSQHGSINKTRKSDYNTYLATIGKFTCYKVILYKYINELRIKIKNKDQKFKSKRQGKRQQQDNFKNHSNNPGEDLARKVI